MRFRWAPAIVLCVGAVLIMGTDRQRVLPLIRPMDDVIPTVIQGYLGEDLFLSDAEVQVAGFSNYLQRVYTRVGADTRTVFQVQVGRPSLLKPMQSRWTAAPSM